MELFYNSYIQHQGDVNYFHKNSPSQIFDRVQNKPLTKALWLASFLINLPNCLFPAFHSQQFLKHTHGASTDGNTSFFHLFCLVPKVPTHHAR